MALLFDGLLSIARASVTGGWMRTPHPSTWFTRMRCIDAKDVAGGRCMPQSPFPGGVPSPDGPDDGRVHLRPWPFERPRAAEGRCYQMAGQMAEQGPSVRQPSVGREETSGRWASGFVVFAGVMMIILGVFHALAGLTAIFEDKFYVVTRTICTRST
jgi:hypothetical protein